MDLKQQNPFQQREAHEKSEELSKYLKAILAEVQKNTDEIQQLKKLIKEKK